MNRIFIGAALSAIALVASITSCSRSERDLQSAYEVLAPVPNAERDRVILVVMDGVRWEDFFDVPERRLSPPEAPPSFAAFWKDLAPSGLVLGDRTRGSRVRVSGRHLLARRLSLPSYHAIFAGYAQPCRNNQCGRIEVETVAEAIRRRLDLPKEKVAIVATDFAIRISAESLKGSVLIDDKTGPPPPPGESWKRRPDRVTMDTALRILREHQPRFLMIQLNESDERAHHRDLEGYLRVLREYDAFILRLFETLDEMGEGQRDRTTVLITTDHGRGGQFLGMWKTHGEIYGAQDVFLAAFGPHTSAVGRAGGEHREVRHADLRPTIELLLGLDPSPCDHPTCGQPIASIVRGQTASADPQRQSQSRW